MRIVFSLGDGDHVRTRGLPPFSHENLPLYQVREIVRHDMTEGYLPHHEARCGGGECIGRGRRLVTADQVGQVLRRLRQTLNDINCNYLKRAEIRGGVSIVDVGMIQNDEVHLCNRH